MYNIIYKVIINIIKLFLLLNIKYYKNIILFNLNSIYQKYKSL